MVDAIPWDVFGKKYFRLFKADTGNVAKPLRTALGALIIQTNMVLFRKRINAQMIAEVNEYMLSNLNKKNDEDDGSKPPTGGGTPNDDFFKVKTAWLSLCWT